MNIEKKIEVRLQQLGAACERLEQYQARGWDVMAATTKVAIARLEREIDQLECAESGYGDESPAEYRRMMAEIGVVL
jgi:hypothetical protein